MKDMSLKYIVRESNLSISEKLALCDFNRSSTRPANEKLEAFAIYIRLLMVMADNKESGFFISVGKKDIVLLAEEFCGADIELVQDVIESLVEHDVFDKEYYKKYNILTSQNIQEKYFYSPNVRRRIKEDLIQYKQYVYPSIWNKLKQKSAETQQSKLEKVECRNEEIACKNGKVACRNEEIACKNEEIACNFEQTKQNKTKQNKTKQNETERETKQEKTPPTDFSYNVKQNVPNELVDLSDKQKRSLTKFFKKFPNKKCELDFKVPPHLDINELIKKVSQSTFLSNANNLNLKWCCEHYNEIISGAYTDFQRLKAKNQRNYHDRDYSGFDFNSIFTDIKNIDL